MANTADNKLVYTGDDPIVWNRVNKLRLEQGLPGLADIGLPRPVDDGKSFNSPYSQYTPATSTYTGSGSKFTFNFGGENFTVNTPAGTTEAQARAIFDQQASTGSLTGLIPGQTLDAAKQFAGGLLAAASQLNVSQLASGLSGLTGGIGSGISSALGAVTRFTGGTTGGITSAALGAASRLTGVPIKNPMNVADFVKHTFKLFQESSSTFLSECALTCFEFAKRQHVKQHQHSIASISITLTVYLLHQCLEAGTDNFTVQYKATIKVVNVS